MWVRAFSSERLRCGASTGRPRQLVKPLVARCAALAVLVLVPAAAAAQRPAGALARLDLRGGAGAPVALPSELREVSGLATSADGRLFAHGDERAVVYQLDPGSGAVVKRFTLGRGVKGDFEGIAIAGKRFFLVDSQGTLYEFREGGDGQSVPYRRLPTGLADQCEVEGLAYAARDNALLLACKTTRGAALRDRIVVFAFSLADMRLQPGARLRIPLGALRPYGLQPSFHTSGIEVHPSGTLLLVAARDEAIVELTADGRILHARRLDRRRHPQPEGIALLPDGSLVVADEAQRGGRASLNVYRPGAAGPRRAGSRTAPPTPIAGAVQP